MSFIFRWKPSVMLGVSLKTLSRWRNRGLLVPLKVSRKKLYTKEAIERFLEEVK